MEDMSLKDGLMALVGALPALPVALLGHPQQAVLAALVGGGLTYMFSDQLLTFVRHRIPALQNPQAVKAWLLSRGDVIESDLVVADPSEQEAPQETCVLPETGAGESHIASSEITPLFPIYPENETLRMGTVVATGQRFDPHFDAVVGKGLIATAMQGFGKSQLCGRVIEQSGKCGVPAMVFDHKGEYKTIKELDFTNVLIAGPTEDYGYLLTPENAEDLVVLMFAGRYQVIVDLPAYGIDSWVERARIVAAVGHALMNYAGRQRQDKQLILPCLVLLDEAQLYLPQNINLLPPEAQSSKEVLSALANAFFSLVSNGRSNGYTMCFATQNLTFIAKWAIKNCAIQVFGNQAEKNVLDMCEDIIESSVATREELRNLEPGVAVVFGFTKEPVIVCFDKKLSRDESETPKIERLRVPLREQVAYQPSASTTRLPETEKLPVQARRTTSALSPDLQAALKAYQAGNTTCREVADALVIGKTKAAELLQQLRARRLITV